ncbi:MAG: hypothetical protein HYY18_05900 [Planctomycetes bacterium]|nr:hypothetical protein [Planctomycetota bacterium]
MELKELLTRTVQQGQWINIRESGGSWILTLDLKGGRKQTVEVRTLSENGIAFARLRSKIGSAQNLEGQRPLAALRMNANLAYGSLAVDGEDYVIQETIMLSESTPTHLIASLQYIANIADQQEKFLGGGDRH